MEPVEALEGPQEPAGCGAAVGWFQTPASWKCDPRPARGPTSAVMDSTIGNTILCVLRVRLLEALRVPAVNRAT